MDYERMWMSCKSEFTKNFSAEEILNSLTRLECLILMTKIEIEEINRKNKPKDKIGF